MEHILDLTGLGYFWGKIKSLFATGTSGRTQAIPFGRVDSTSTSTAYTATVAGITELKDGTCVYLMNGVVTSAANFTININDLGAKPSYNNMATGNSVTPTAPTRDTTIFNINYTMLFVYNSTLVDGGCWVCYRGYDSNTNTSGTLDTTETTTQNTSSSESLSGNIKLHKVSKTGLYSDLINAPQYVICTQAEYDALSEYNANTYYIIISDNAQS